MHHSEVIKLVEKYLADPESVSKEDLWGAADAVDDAYWDGYRDAADIDADFWAAEAAEAAADADDAGYWTNKAKNSVAKYHEITGA